MKLPGFTADASIYRNKGQYQMLGSPVSLSGKTSVYQAGGITPAGNNCDFNCIMCGLSRDPNSDWCTYCKNKC